MHAIETLGPEDRAHFVVYDDLVDTIFESGTIQQAQYLTELVKKRTFWRKYKFIWRIRARSKNHTKT